MLAYLAPGQGSQRPGMLADLVAGNEATLARWSDLAGLDLVVAGTGWDAEQLRATEVAQPLLAATSLLAARALAERPDVVAGHSVGAWVAAAVAGVLTDDDCVRLVAARGRAMAACCDGSHGMAAVLGGTDTDRTVAAIEGAGLTAANVNGAGQVVAAGPLADLAALTVDGGRVRPLPVAGAFHSPAMAPATDRLQPPVGGAPTCVLVSDVDGTVVVDGAAYPERLVEAIARPVRFDLVWARLASLGVSRVVELAPAGVLTALARRALPGVALGEPVAA